MIIEIRNSHGELLARSKTIDQCIEHLVKVIEYKDRRLSVMNDFTSAIMELTPNVEGVAKSHRQGYVTGWTEYNAMIREISRMITSIVNDPH